MKSFTVARRLIFPGKDVRYGYHNPFPGRSPARERPDLNRQAGNEKSLARRLI